MTQYILLYHDYFDNRKWDGILSKIKNIEQFKQIDKSFLWFLYQKYLMLLYQGKSVKDLDFDFLTNFACLQDFTVKEVKYLIQQVNIQLTKHKFLDKNLRIPADKIKKYNPNFNKIQQPVNKVNNQLTKVNNELTLVNKSVNNELTNELTNNFVNQLTKKYNSLRSFICQIKKGKKRPKTHTLEELEEQLKNVKKQLKNAFVNQPVNNELTTVNNRLTNQLTTVNKKLTGGYRGVTYTDLKENREKRIEKEVVVVTEDRGVTGEKGENLLTTTTTTDFSSKSQKTTDSQTECQLAKPVNNRLTPVNKPSTEEKNTPAQGNQQPTIKLQPDPDFPQTKTFNSRKIMNTLQKCHRYAIGNYQIPVDCVIFRSKQANVVTLETIKIFKIENLKFLQDYAKMVNNLITFTTPICQIVSKAVKCDLEKFGAQFNKIFELLDENTNVPYTFNNLTTQEKFNKKQEMLLEIRKEVKENQGCCLMALYEFLNQYYGKKNNKGHNFDCPNFADLQNFIKNNIGSYKAYNDKLTVKLKHLSSRINELKQQTIEQPQVNVENTTDEKSDDDIEQTCNTIFCYTGESKVAVL